MWWMDPTTILGGAQALILPFRSPEGTRKRAALSGHRTKPERGCPQRAAKVRLCRRVF
jgi:hypothetical protein